MTIDAQDFVTDNSPKIKMFFTNKTIFSSVFAIHRNTHVSISYINGSDLIITPKLYIMNSNQTELYEYWGVSASYHLFTIPKTVTTIKERAFENSNVSKLDFEADSQLISIENYAFRNCSKLYSLDFSSAGLRYIGIESFKECIKLSSVNFISKLLVIMNNAFENCIKLQSVNNLNNIPDSCFCGCTNLRSVNILENSRLIGYKSFENCYSLESINIPSFIETISEYSFLNCIKLNSINFTERNNLVKISNNSFSGCNSLQKISNFDSDRCKCIDNTIYYKNKTGEYLIFHLNRSLDKTLIINCSVICSYSFNECNNIYNITILPSSVSLIEKYSFNNCLNLQHINFPLSVQNVESHSFVECRSIRCPLIIENTKLDFLRMIIYSGIPRNLIVSCKIYHDTRDFETPYIYDIASTTLILTSFCK
ncbi:leucine Rich Repeat domain protein, putative [Trichomonas vaginalis G3]|uniref:Leucine Rich Repeat domain protein, putative n=1 Tax=Trichomonas vaginalis (strain ATCC PRA-98 / G3) TaxID=412133 RepID=A2DX93_TRIV3|nr:amphoterin-induced protein family [Trichomonas vaginalis G3]EAY14975.1 leucine Rich Repeat domain protein, putative [Trichomonas vaginalis G3]KAI5507352.1 amphoterin-induced protein family [Trichomonas vaginalis G3]|eukprot:XP_001327198.1 leucine Rich Repeat domain protein [Trichomonas vaginalis G3]